MGFIGLTCLIQPRSTKRRKVLPGSTSLPSSSAAAAAAAAGVCCEYMCECAVRSLNKCAARKTSPLYTGSVFLEPNLWVGALLWKAWKLGSSRSQDEWEEGAHQRAEPWGWAQIRSFSGLIQHISLLYWCHMNFRLCAYSNVAYSCVEIVCLVTFFLWWSLALLSRWGFVLQNNILLWMLFKVDAYFMQINRKTTFAVLAFCLY